MRIRALFLVFMVVLFVTTHDLIQRTLLPLILKCLPSKREGILSAWCRWVSNTFVNIARLSGIGNFATQRLIPADSGVLILMNHQSLLDVPLVVTCLQGGYPLIVTRERYARKIPLISGIVRLYGFPTVNPRAGRKTDVSTLVKAAKTSKPVVVYPEGTRSRNGDLLPFKAGALTVLLDKRQWKVYLLVADGAWRFTTFGDIASLKEKINWKMKVLGPFDSPENLDDLPAWLRDMEDLMRKGLASLKEGS